MLKLVVSIGVLFRETAAIRCIVCSETQDHHGNPIASSDQGSGCFTGKLDNVEDYLLECPSSQPYCGVEFFADWFPRGFQQFSVRRGCRSQPAPADCTSSALPGFQYKDCYTTCDNGDGCNDKNDVFSKATELNEDGRPREIDCLSCSSDFDTEADVNGKPFCYTEGNPRSCPVYANAGCFKSKALVDFDDARENEDHYYKGCSTFKLKDGWTEDQPECSNALNDGAHWLMCDNICQGEKDKPCNVGSTTGGTKMCYTCETMVNQAGDMVGWGDPSCLLNPHQYHLEVCDQDQDVCVTQFKAEWKLLGEQHYTMRRGCGKSSEIEADCLQIDARNYKAKECIKMCRDLNAAGCNNGTEIFNEFAGDAVETCRTCSDHIFGNQASTDCAAFESTSQECPIYARQGCFSSRFVYDTNADQESDTYHGCSSFRTRGDGKECFNVNVDDGYNHGEMKTTCKETCVTDDCNQKITDIIDGQDSLHFCAVCTVRMDHFNNTVGEGDPRCWGEEVPSQFYTACEEGLNFCVTDIEVDWAARGDQVTTLRRSCAATPAPTTCMQGAIQTWQYKDCSTTCSNNLLTACNTNMYDTALLFARDEWDHHQHSCYNCETHSNGEHPNDCGPNTGPIGGPEAIRNIVNCPKYADYGCFTSIVQHEEGGEMIEDIIRGCSTFDQEYACSGWTERQVDDNGQPIGVVEWNACKEACFESNCNQDQAIVAGDNRCYTCTAQVDSHGDPFGVGQGACFSSDMSTLDNSLVLDCGKDEYCLTDMEVDWLPMGDQITTIRRRCAKEEIVPKCETSVSNGWAMKDCFTTCKGALCNDDLSIANMLSDDVVSECYSCKFNEFTAGDSHNDTMNCKLSPKDETIQSCPVWASAACFVADAVVRTEEDEDLVNIFRGCSTFGADLFGDMMKCSTLTVDVAVDTHDPYRAEASTCKQVCADGDDCNNIRYPDYNPPQEDCPPCEGSGVVHTALGLCLMMLIAL